MLAFVSGAGPVGDLIPFEAGGGEQVVSDLVFSGLVIVIGLGQSAGRDLTAHFRGGFHGQCVGGDVVYAKIDGGRDRGAPIVKALPRSAVNQIHAGAQPSLVRRIDAYGHVGRRMRAVEGFEHVRHGRLHAEGNTGEAAGSELIDVILVDRVRIGFGSDFRVGRDAPDLADGIEHGDQIAGGENCGGAAAEEHGGDRRLLDAVVELPLLGQFHFPNDHIGIVAARGPRTKIRSRVGVEVAVTAAPQAERDVDVDLEH